MCFCTCTPQTSARRGWQAACTLRERGLLEHGSAEAVGNALRECGVRFHNHKARYITQNREAFYPHTKARLEPILSHDHDPQTTLAAKAAGWGMKEAAHFLRNIGFGHVSSILDRHILRRLANYGVLPAIPKSFSPARYRDIDGAMKTFARSCGIPLAALDFVFWYQETGELFK
jgi:N-glycosylase/DNA lyase